MNVLKKLVRNITNSLFFNTKNPHQVPRDAYHLHNEYRRILCSPDAAVHALMEIALKDEHFRALLPENEGPALVRLAVVGGFIYANVYELYEFPGGPMEHPYNDDWRKDSIVDYLVHTEASHDDEGPVFAHSIDPLIRHYHTVHSYDPDEPVASYALPLTKEELEIINRLTIVHHHRRQAA